MERSIFDGHFRNHATESKQEDHHYHYKNYKRQGIGDLLIPCDFVVFVTHVKLLLVIIAAGLVLIEIVKTNRRDKDFSHYL